MKKTIPHLFPHSIVESSYVTFFLNEVMEVQEFKWKIFTQISAKTFVI